MCDNFRCLQHRHVQIGYVGIEPRVVRSVCVRMFVLYEGDRLHASRDHLEWRAWAKATGAARLDTDQGLEFDFLEHTLQAAIRG